MPINYLAKLLAPYPPFRYKQVIQAIFKDLIKDWDEVTTLPRDIKELLSEQGGDLLELGVETKDHGDSIKALITLDDGKRIETVLMRYKSGKNVVCVSCQVGCSMKCAFCATGKMGIKRNLTLDEIIIQVLYFQRYLKTELAQVSNVVFMGMGEPFLNYETVLEAIRIINDPQYFGIGVRHMTVSTCGIIPGIERFRHENLQVKLAISLHASNDKLRSELMPVNKEYPIDQLILALKKYISKTRRKVMIEYILLDNINDRPDQAEELSKLLKKYLGSLFMVNLIAYNEIGEGYSSPSRERIKEFRQVLEDRNVEVTQRFKLGQEVDGGCGQLVIN